MSEVENSPNTKISSENKAQNGQVGQNQVHDLLFGEKLSWQAIIYDLINSEQLDPWNIDISLLSNRYLEKVREIESHDFFVSSKVLLAAALLLRIKSEILLNRDIRSLDDILFGKKEEKKYVQERIELDDEIPDLVPRTPLPRHRRVTLKELMSALGKAIKTETRRIRRVVVSKQREMETALVLPKKSINLKDSIKDIYKKLKSIFLNRNERLSFTELAGTDKDKRIETFMPLLHLDNQQKVWLEQEGHFEEIWIWLKTLYEEKNAETLALLRKEVDEEMEKMDMPEAEKKERAESIKEELLGKKLD